MKKKLLAICLIGLFLFTFIGCSNKEEITSKEPTTTTDSTTAKDDSDKKPDNNTSKDNDELTPTDTSKDNNKKPNETTQPEIKTSTCRLFFYDINADKFFYVDKLVNIKDGALVKALSKSHKENKDSDTFVKLHSEAQVTSAKVNGDVLEIYFNKDFQSKMNLGSGAECGLIDSLVNTYGYNFNVKKVAIYSDNQLFTGVRGTVPNGYYTVDYSKAEPLK